MAVPGSIVGVGKLITPGGQQGPKGDAGTAANVPLADITQNGLLRQTPGLTTSFLDGTNNYQNLVTAIQPTLWSVRQKSYNSIGNGNFDVDQVNVKAAVTVPVGSIKVCDRWFGNRAGTMVMGALADTTVILSPPGSTWKPSSSALKVQLNTAQASLGASDFFHISQIIEGPSFRPLLGDVHSLSLLVQSSVAPLTFCVALSDVPATKTLVKLCTISTANSATLISLPNLPSFTGGNFTLTAGAVGYTIKIVLCAGSSFIAPAPDVWNSGVFLGAAGISNFANNPVSSNFIVQLVQHEPGPQCSSFQEKLFFQNYEECLRYYAKSYDYATAIGTVVVNGIRQLVTLAASTNAFGSVYYPKPMAKVPTVVLYNHSTGAANSVQDGAAVNHASAAVGQNGEKGFTAMSFTTATGAAMQVNCHFTADSGW